MIAFSKNGKGLPVILIHGFCERKEMWKTFSDHLSTSYTVYCPDLPGFGESTLQEEKTNLESIAVNLSEWMDEEGIRKPVIIGHSLGGYVTLALAELLGNEIKGIGLFHSTAMPDDMAKKKTRNKTITFLKNMVWISSWIHLSRHYLPRLTKTIIPTPLTGSLKQGKLVH